MWVPDSTEQFEAKVRSGELFEHSGFEVKRQPVSSFKMARAIAGLAAGGGLFVLGVDEDDDKRLTVPSPIALAGAAERIDNIVRDGIREVPAIRIQALPLADDPGRGYLVVVVPASPRAPHMVILDEDNRFYERSARSTVPMDEHKVALYYERRARQHVDRDRLLDATVAWHQPEPDPLHAELHAFARPAHLDHQLWAQAASAMANRDALAAALGEAARDSPLSLDGFAPDLKSTAHERYGGTAYRWKREGTSERYAAQGDLRERHVALLCEIEETGEARLFFNRVGERFTPSNVQPAEEGLHLWLDMALGTLTSFVVMVGELYRRAPYHGPVDLGKLRGLEGGVYETERRWGTRPYERDLERQHRRRSALDLIDQPAAVAVDLLRGFLERLHGEGFEPPLRPGRR